MHRMSKNNNEVENLAVLDGRPMCQPENYRWSKSPGTSNYSSVDNLIKKQRLGGKCERERERERKRAVSCLLVAGRAG